MGRMFFFNDAWTKNEALAKELAYKEPMYTGHEKAPRKKKGPQQVELIEDAAVGLDGRDFHFKGDRVSKLHEEAIPGGDVAVYWRREDGTIYRNTWRKVGDGRHVNSGEMRPVRSF